MAYKIKKGSRNPGFQECKGCGTFHDNKDLATIDRGGRRGIVKRCMPCTWAYLKTLGEMPKQTPSEDDSQGTLL